MSTIRMKEFGPILTGRDFGKKVMQELQGKLVFPVALDFSDTLSLGSSFGDEVVPVIAKQQGGRIAALNPNKAVWACLQGIAKEHQIEIARQ